MIVFIHKIAILSFTIAVIGFSYNEQYTYIPKVSGFVLIALYLYYLLNKHRQRHTTREAYIISMWLFLSTISCMLSLDLDIATAKLYTLLQLFPVIFSLYILIATSRLATYAISVIIIITFIVSVPTYIHPEQYSLMGRAMATFNNPNLYGYILLVSIISCVRLGLSSSHITISIFCICACMFFTYMLIETASRKAFISLFISLFMLSYMHIRTSPKNNRIISIITIIIFTSVIVTTSITLLNKSSKGYRINNLLTAITSKNIDKAEGSDRGRLTLYQTGFKSLLRNPLGIGLDNFRNLKIQQANQNKIGTYSHSNYIEVAVSTGFLGFIVYYSFYASILHRLYSLRKIKLSRNDQSLYDISLCLIILTLIYDFAMVSYYEKITWLVLAITYAISTILENNIRSRHPH